LYTDRYLGQFRLHTSLAVPKSTSRKTETVSFRIDGGLRRALEKESDRLGVNLNTLASMIFNRYVNWWQYVGRLKFLPASKDFLREIFREMDQETIRRTGKRLGENIAVEEIQFLFRRVDSEAVLKFLELWSSHFDAYDHEVDGRKHSFTIHHDVNLNFSIFLKEYINSILENTLERPVHFDGVSQNMLAFDFEI
jgi:hypothetical protein